MSGFDHPGGPIMLKLGEGRNATAMFEAHHPFTNRAYLER
jgi:delta11-fatty-acid desaturase